MAHRRTQPAALISTMVVLLACGTQDEPETASGAGGGGPSDVTSQGAGGETTSPGLIIGTGQQTLEPWPEGGSVTLHRGCQGLQHIYVSVVSDTLTNGRWLVDLSLVHRVNGETLSIPYEVLLRPERIGAGLWGLVGLNLVVPYPEDVLDEPLTLEATVHEEPAQDESEPEAQGPRATASVDAHIVWGADHCGGH